MKPFLIGLVSGVIISAGAFFIISRPSSVSAPIVKTVTISGEPIRITPQEIKNNVAEFSATATGAGETRFSVPEDFFPAARKWKEKRNALFLTASSRKDLQLLYYRRFDCFLIGSGAGVNFNSGRISDGKIFLSAGFIF